MDQQLDHFSHHHPLNLVYLKQPNHQNEYDDDDNDDEDEMEDKDDFVEEEHYGRQCNMCKEQTGHLICVTTSARLVTTYCTNFAQNYPDPTKSPVTSRPYSYIKLS